MQSYSPIYMVQRESSKRVQSSNALFASVLPYRPFRNLIWTQSQPYWNLWSSGKTKQTIEIGDEGIFQAVHSFVSDRSCTKQLWANRSAPKPHSLNCFSLKEYAVSHGDARVFHQHKHPSLLEQLLLELSRDPLFRTVCHGPAVTALILFSNRTHHISFFSLLIITRKTDLKWNFESVTARSCNSRR